MNQGLRTSSRDAVASHDEKGNLFKCIYKYTFKISSSSFRVILHIHSAIDHSAERRFTDLLNISADSKEEESHTKRVATAKL